MVTGTAWCAPAVTYFFPEEATFWKILDFKLLKTEFLETVFVFVLTGLRHNAGSSQAFAV